MAGIYIHIPFCKQACTYCNFHFSTGLGQKSEMLKAIHKEIRLTSPDFFSSEKIETIYFGGGTPSLLSAGELDTILTLLNKEFNIGNSVEITLEANPDDINTPVLQQWFRIGINRISLGVQSFLESELVWMNRAHHAFESLESIRQIKEAGFENFSVDLIYGSPLLSNDDFTKNLEIVTREKIPHISCYALTVEPKTVLHKQIKLKRSLPVAQARQAEQFILLTDILQEKGYEHYEISNFAFPGMRSKHNSSYWRGSAYIGLGPSAHSYDGINKRRWNIANNASYIRSLQNDLIPFEEEVLDQTQQLNEYIMITLRTMEGLDMNRVKEKFGPASYDTIQLISRKYINSGKLSFKNEWLILTAEGKLFADGIAADLFF